MTRKEEIEKEAMQVAGVHPDWSNFECFRMGFREGAKFADKTMLDRACEWLEDTDFDMEYWNQENGFCKEEFITAFRQAMEGGVE